MDASEEKFFEQLAGATASADDEYQVELAKADTSATAMRARTSAKMSAAGMKEPEAHWEDGESEGQLTVDVYQTETEIVVESAIAGVRSEDLDIQVMPDSIAIKGSRHREKEVKDEDYIYQECYWGKFARSLILPQEIDPESASVTFKNGILTIRLPKADKKKMKKLKVKID